MKEAWTDPVELLDAAIRQTEAATGYDDETARALERFGCVMFWRAIGLMVAREAVGKV